MSWLNWPQWQKRIDKQTDAQRTQREDERHDALLAALGGITDELRTGHLQDNEAEDRKSTRECASTVGLLITAAAAAAGLILSIIQIHKSREALLLDQRAWLAIKSFQYSASPAAGKEEEIIITYTNTGKTPGLHVALTNCGTGDTEKATLTWVCPRGYEGVSAPGQDLVFSNLSEPVSQVLIERLKEGTQRTYYRGVIEYDDIFGEKHHTGFCVFYPGTEKAQFMECPSGNYMD